MATLSAADLHQQLKWRYATKKFDSTKKIPSDIWKVLEESLVLTPSSYGLQPWKFFVVTSEEVKSKLPELSWGQSQPKDCSQMVVFAIKKGLAEVDIDRYLARISEVRSTPIESLAGFKKMMLGTFSNPAMNLEEWAKHQVYIALGQFMASAAVLGVDTCPMEGIVPAKYDELLGIANQGYHTVVGCAAGYRATDDQYAVAPKVRFKNEEVIQTI